MLSCHRMTTGYKNNKSDEKFLNFGHENQFYYSVMKFSKSYKLWQLDQTLHYTTNTVKVLLSGIQVIVKLN